MSAPCPPIKAVFFDFDDTLSEHQQFSKKFVATMAHALWICEGGMQARWQQGVVQMMARLEASYIARFCPPEGPRPFGYRQWLCQARVWATQWLYEGVNRNPSERAESLVKAAQKAALHSTQALFPGAREVVQALELRGFSLYIASGNDSKTLHHALIGCGLRSYFRKLFGPDLTDCAKEGPEYYQAVFANLQIAPHEALVIDNAPEAIDWACKAGAWALQVRLRSNDPEPLAKEAISALADIRELLRFPFLRSAVH